MINPRNVTILIRDLKTNQFEDKTWQVSEIQPTGQQIRIVFNGNNKPYWYRWDRVQMLGDPEQHALSEGERVFVDGTLWESATEVRTFTGAGGAWCRIFYRARGGEDYRTCVASRVRIITSADETPAIASVLRYWRAVVSRLSRDDPLRPPYDRLVFVHPESVLNSFLAGSPIEPRPMEIAPVFPFRCNLSQRAAVENALTHSISVIEGPPGTGKTETILNLIANIVAVHHMTVGIVSFGNAAVDNVHDKLAEQGFGHVIGNLGRKTRRDEFFARQKIRNAEVAQFLDHAPDRPDLERLQDLDKRLRGLQDAERIRASRRQALDAHRLELRHFEDHLHRDELPDLTGLPLLRRSADRILDYLAESELELVGIRPGPLRRIRNYFKYGSVRSLDPADTRAVLQLQLTYYHKRIAELEREIGRVEDQLRRADFERLAQQHQELSRQLLHADLAARYRERHGAVYEPDTYRRGHTFSDFITDYPAVLSTCHSLRDSIAAGYLFDYLVIDEASQVNLLLAGLAMSCARHVVVVGDQRQLPPVPVDAADGLLPPIPGYDCQRNLLASLSDLYGASLPRTLLREHYRCDPVIIGFCNKKFYDGDLIPYKTSTDDQPMILVRTVEGNHMRRHREGGRSNHRELDAIVQEVIPAAYRQGFARTDIGVTTPYRHQASKAADVLDQTVADTIHKFQGRQKQMVILTTVLDETWRGQTGLAFVDDPQMINVAVSRAIRRFILVTNHDMLPKSRHIRDLVGYIRYHNPDDEIVDSAVISVFDLLYRAYSQRLLPLAARLRKELKYPSEDIVWTVLHDIIAEPDYAHLTVSTQVLLRNLLPNLGRLTPEQTAYVRHRASVDLVVYNRVTNQPLLAIEVDGFAFHENNPDQLARDKLKNEILSAYQLRLLRLPTTGSGEYEKIRQALDNAGAR